MADEKIHVFVYGTLKNLGTKMHCSEARLVGNFQTKDSFLMFDGPYPLAIRADSAEAETYSVEVNHTYSGHVVGEIWSVPLKLLTYLDQYEGAPSYYEGVYTPFVDRFGDEMSAIMYRGKGVCKSIPHRKQIESDDDGCLVWPVVRHGFVSVLEKEGI